MKIKLILIGIFLSSLCLGQSKQKKGKAKTVDHVFYDTKNFDQIQVIYRPIYNNIQMVEVDVNTHLRLMHIKQYAARDLSVAYCDIHNPIYLRNSDGKILDAFNDDKREFQKYIKLSVQQSLPLATCHINNQNNIFPNWEKATEISSESSDFEHYTNNDFRRIFTAREYMPYDKPYKWVYVVHRNNKFGVIDSLGNYVVPIAYKNIIAYKYGYFVSDSFNNKSPSEDNFAFLDDWGFISKDLKHKIPCSYHAIQCIDGEQFIVSKNNKEGIININNQPIADMEFTEITPYKHFYFYKKENTADTTKNGYPVIRCGLIKKDGTPQPMPDVLSITKIEYGAYNNQSIKYFFAHSRKGIYILDEYGNMVCNYYFDREPAVNYYKQWQGFIKDTLLNNELREIHLDSNFNEIKTSKYYSARSLGNMDTLIAVLKVENGKRFLQYGVSRFGRIILDTVYDRIHKMAQFNNLLFTQKTNKTSIYFTTGELALKDTDFMYFLYHGSDVIRGTKEIIYKVENGVKTAHPVFECFKCWHNQVMPWKCE